MGITTYLFTKENSLEQQRFNMFFLDMGENIHFHYRDLRIELSVDEFIELAEQFNTYAQGVIAEIKDGYHDGVLANTNETGTLKTFWDKDKKLQHPVKYNEQRLVVEETKDGYHLHIRNYKLLVGKQSFAALVRAMARIQPLLEAGELERDPLALLEQNELEAQLVQRMVTARGERLVVAVPKVYRKKAAQVLLAIGFHRETTGDDGVPIFVREQTTVSLVSPGTEVDRSLPGEARVHPLPTYLKRFGRDLDPPALNTLKLKVLALLKLAATGTLPALGLANIHVDEQTLQATVDLFSDQPTADPAAEIDSFNSLLGKLKLFFVKPEKEYLPRDRQDEVQDAFFDFVMARIASHPGVKKIYTLGSSTQYRIGRYQVPFVHFDWVKLCSDFDIYVEIDPDYEGSLAEGWEKKFYWPKTGSDYYHFGDVGRGMESSFASRFPAVRFYEHLVEGYVFDSRTGDLGKRDAWFAKTKARCIFSRDHLADWINRQYPISPVDTQKFSAASFNKVYRVATSQARYVLKVYEDKHLSKKDQKKIVYEIGLLDALGSSGLEINLPVKNNAGNYISDKDGNQAVLYTMVPGQYVADPDPDQVRCAGNLLARYHLAAKNYHSKFATQYKITDKLRYWLQAWREYHQQGVVGTEVSLTVEKYRRQLSRLNLFQTHCHGDLSVINYLFDGKNCWLIDFQSIGFGPAIVDLANGMVEFSARRKDFLHDNLTYFREGYEEVRPLSSPEAEFLQHMLLIQLVVRQAKLIRLHLGGYGYDLKEERLIGLRMGLEYLLENPGRD